MCLALHVCKTEHTHQGRHSQLAHCRTGHVSHLPHTIKVPFYHWLDLQRHIRTQ
ncbi:MAG: hypothetical protein H6Q05_4516, partial [Acidobacteria bacterium]|nr:hypothetical protein [Acidobacteriota bacterium]